jgi:hypothetical protein
MANAFGQVMANCICRRCTSDREGAGVRCLRVLLVARLYTLSMAIRSIDRSSRDRILSLVAPPVSREQPEQEAEAQAVAVAERRPVAAAAAEPAAGRIPQGAPLGSGRQAAWHCATA